MLPRALSAFSRGKKRRIIRHVSTQEYLPTQTPILIVGGGPTGLFLANLFQSYQIPFTLLEAQSVQQRFRHPQAHFLNTRTMELLRHTLPSQVYSNIRKAMPPVEEWKSFRFGPDMTSTGTMAEVIHPVERPLRANQDTNGKLVDAGNATHQVKDNEFDLSDCAVGHLAQHTFCRILYDAAVENCTRRNDNHILFNSLATFAERKQDGLWHVGTDNGDEFEAPVIIATDGAKSGWRKMVGIQMNGKETIQNLVNVHFTLTGDDPFPPAMLYTVFSPDVLAMVVRHSSKEYVMQIPYFPPYQTLEDNFTKEKVQSMVSAALGGSHAFKVQSIGPWSMGSLVAEEYYSQQLFLVGDSAHVFPPAGGFGMNTGLQDAHNLAWRLALATDKIDSIGRAYQSDRQPVARQNAALSVRNYQRVLDVMNACYLNHQHPEVLIQGLNASSFFIPMEIRRQTFQAALETALWPLKQLKAAPDGFLSKHITNNVRQLLAKGRGLPLLFPNHELGFRYGSVNSSHSDDGSADTIAEAPTLVNGGLFPHLRATVHDRAKELFPQLRELDEQKVTTRDLPAQLATAHVPCAFCVLQITVCHDGTTAESPSPVIAEGLQRELELPFMQARLQIVGDGRTSCLPSTATCLNLQLDRSTWFDLKLTNDPNAETIWVVIRPDSHVAGILSLEDDDSVDPDTIIQTLAAETRKLL
eukprot:scaffold1469_cov119-Cylindrotheca_fusiformis.AAC.23